MESVLLTLCVVLVGLTMTAVIALALSGLGERQPASITIHVDAGDHRRIGLSDDMLATIRRAIGEPDRVDAADWRVVDDSQPCMTGCEQGAPATLARAAKALTAGPARAWTPALRPRIEVIYYDHE